MISRRIYQEEYTISQLLHVFQHDHSFATRAAAARIIYWDFSFNFGADSTFARTALKFIAAGGLKTLIKCALTAIQPISTTHHAHPLLFYRSITRILGSPSPCPTRVFTLVDVEFQLPHFALGYDTASIIGAHHESASLRRLSLEILSEMSNYAVYRSEIGASENALNGLLGLLKFYSLEFVNYEKAQNLHIVNSNLVFLLDRLVNFCANLAMDGGRVEMSRCRKGYFTRVFEKEKKMGYQLRLCLNSVEATSNIACYLLDTIGQFVLAVGDKTTCPYLKSNCARFLCNSLGYANKRIIYRLARIDLRYSLDEWLKFFVTRSNLLFHDQRMNVVDDNEEDLDILLSRINTGLRSTTRALTWCKRGMTELLNTHRVSYVEWIEERFDLLN